MKTQYRLITKDGYQFLQFKSTKTVRCFPKIWKTKKVECWRYIFEEDYASIMGFGLTEYDCPDELPDFYAGTRCIRCYSGSSEDKLRPFARKYPDIQVYFDEIKARWDALLAREAAEEAANNTVELL